MNFLRLITSLGLGLCLVACGRKPAKSPGTIPETDSTARMIERLERISDSLDIQQNGFLNDRRAAYWKQWLAGNPDPMAKAQQLMPMVQDFIRANENKAALDLLNAVSLQGIPDEATRITAQNELDMWKAMAWLRLGERQNCVSHHTSESCILPIGSGGVHQNKEGSGAAQDHLLQILKRAPDHLGAIWLLNLTSMTLGEYPDGVPKQFRIPEKAFHSPSTFPRFPDVAKSAGVDVMGLAGGGVTADFNNDHQLDLFVTSHGLRDQVRLFFGRAGEPFEDVTERSGLLGMHGGFNLVCADYNNDGFLDVFILRGAWWMDQGRFPNSLLRNNGDGTFTDVTEAAGLLSFQPTQTAVWFDYNGDGWIDLFVGNELDRNGPIPSEFYENDGDGAFTEKAASVGLSVKKYVKGVTSADYNNDGRPDLFVSIFGESNLLFRNDGETADGWRFTEVAKVAGVTEPRASFPCWFWDYDNDGWEDLFVAGYEMNGIGEMAAALLGRANTAVGPRLYRNNRQGGFEDLTEQSGIDHCWLPMGVNFGDLDNDGWLDFYVGTGLPRFEYLLPNRMYRGAATGRFQDVTYTGGFGHLQKGHAISFADLDNDGDQDVHIVMGGAYSGDTYMNALFRNPGNANRWLKLKLLGARSNRAAIGARIHVTVNTPNGTRHIHRTVGTGGSFGCNPLRQEIGLGNATALLSVEVVWPASGIEQSFTGLSLNSLHEIHEEQDSPVRVRLPTN